MIQVHSLRRFIFLGLLFLPFSFLGGCVSNPKQACESFDKDQRKIKEHLEIVKLLLPFRELPNLRDQNEVIGGWSSTQAPLVRQYRSQLERSYWTQFTRWGLDRAQDLLDYLGETPERAHLQDRVQQVANQWVIANGYIASGKLIVFETYLNQINAELQSIKLDLCPLTGSDAVIEKRQN